ncbi:ATP-binding cassette domain-containing protein [Streptomyces sp. NPDC001443]
MLQVIQAFGLTSNHRKGLPPAVDDVSFEARGGRVTTLLGAADAGKTAALKLMLELQHGRGVTHFRGRPLHHIPHPSHEVGVLLGDVPGHPARTVRGHLRMLCAAAGVPARRADEVLEVVGLVSLRHERLGTLSRGMDRRLGLACALLPDPHTLVLDAPTAGLNAREGRWLHGMLRAHAAQGGTVLLTTADPKEAARTADRIVTLERGRVVADQEAEDFARTRLRPRVAVRSPQATRLAAALSKEARAARRSVEVVQDGGNRLCVYGSTCADVGETAFRHGILVHKLADETGDMGPGAEAGPNGPWSGELPDAGEPGTRTRWRGRRLPVVPDTASLAVGPPPAPTQTSLEHGTVHPAGRPHPSDEDLLSADVPHPSVGDLPYDDGPDPSDGGPPAPDAPHPSMGESPSVDVPHPSADVPRPSVGEPKSAGVPQPSVDVSRPSVDGSPSVDGRRSAAAVAAVSLPLANASAPLADEPPRRTDAPLPFPATSPHPRTATVPGGGEATHAHESPRVREASKTRELSDAGETHAVVVLTEAPGAAVPEASGTAVSEAAEAAVSTGAQAVASAGPVPDGTPSSGTAGPHASGTSPTPAEPPTPDGAGASGRSGTHPPRTPGPRTAARTPRPVGPGALDSLSELPPPISVRPAPSPLRPLRYELRRAAGIGTGFFTAAAVLVASALTAVLLARAGHTSPPRLLAAWPRELPLPPAALGAGLLGAFAFGDEFRHPALAADRGTVPRRLGLLAAKLLVSAVTALLLAFLTVGCDAEALYVVYGRELAQVPADWFSLSFAWAGLVVGCAWAGVLAAGVFRSTSAGLAAVVAVPVVVVPLVQEVLQGASVRRAAGLSVRLREVFLWQWPFGGERYLAGVARVIVQPVGGAMTLSLTALLCAYLLMILRSRAR